MATAQNIANTIVTLFVAATKDGLSPVSQGECLKEIFSVHGYLLVGPSAIASSTTGVPTKRKRAVKPKDPNAVKSPKSVSWSLLWINKDHGGKKHFGPRYDAAKQHMVDNKMKITHFGVLLHLKTMITFQEYVAWAQGLKDAKCIDTPAELPKATSTPRPDVEAAAAAAPVVAAAAPVVVAAPAPAPKAKQPVLSDAE